MAGLCEGGNEPPGSLKAIDFWLRLQCVAVTEHLKAQELVIYCKKLIFSYHIPVFENMNEVPCTSALYVKPSTELYATPELHNSLILASSEFQSLRRAIVKEDEYEEVRWDGTVSIVSWRERVFRLWWEESICRESSCVPFVQKPSADLAGQRGPHVRLQYLPHVLAAELH
ncbi:hypothetical protein ANN_25873 [Periplaneta americana]|uniref:Uncharacterized protein n=1 Tax=Periplaneta americana TaxID=6978 RepID=A0ABQ8S552_PERAM|nr:hypothetical protein ANN_25873 [Periplaneta americana]